MHDEVLPAGETTLAAYRQKRPAYFAGARVDFLDRLPKSSDARLLEIGCGSGETGALALARGVAGHYTGVELMPGPAARAREVLSEVIVGDVEAMDLPWQPASFDAVILSEVLEHLREPEALLKRLARHVRPGGTVLASSPNISHWKVLATLARGRFPQEDSGVFDRTHLRWFTPATFAGMFERAGFEVVAVGPVRPPSRKAAALTWLSGGALQHLFMTQIALEGRRPLVDR